MENNFEFTIKETNDGVDFIAATCCANHLAKFIAHCMKEEKQIAEIILKAVQSYEGKAELNFSHN